MVLYCMLSPLLPKTEMSKGQNSALFILEKTFKRNNAIFVAIWDCCGGMNRGSLCGWCVDWS